MDTILNWYFSWDYNIYFAIVIMVGWIISGRFIARKHANKKDYLAKKWWFWTGNILVVLNISLITWINPAYWGYGNPLYFNYIQVTDDHVLLYDTQYAYYESDNSSSSHEETVPNLRVHVVDRQTHKKLFTKHIGDYFYPIDYGKFPLIIENDTYYDSSPNDEIQSMSFFDVTAQECRVIAKDGMKIAVEGDSIEVYDMFKEYDGYRIKTITGDVAQLRKDEPLFVWLVENNEAVNNEVSMSLHRDPVSKDKNILRIQGELTDLTFLKGNIVNRIIQDNVTYIMIYSLNNLEKTNPKLSLINEYGEMKWEQDLNSLKEIANDDDLKYIHRSILVENCCYITSGPYLFEFDLLSGSLNWWMKV